MESSLKLLLARIQKFTSHTFHVFLRDLIPREYQDDAPLLSGPILFALACTSGLFSWINKSMSASIEDETSQGALSKMGWNNNIP
jgi:hypothetical protein